MPAIRELLQRFRPAGAPGAASRAGVPADRVAEVSAELASVFAALGSAQVAAARLRAEAERESAAIIDAARAQRLEILADARNRVDAARAEAFVTARSLADAAGARLLAEGRAAADRVRAAGDRRMAQYVDLVVAAARQELFASSARPEPARALDA